MFIRQIGALVLLFMLSLSLSCVPAVSKGNPNQLKKYVSDHPPFILFKPENWKVQQEYSPEALRVSVTDPEATFLVEFFFADNRASRMDSLQLLGFQTKKLKSRYPQLVVSEVLACKDRSCAVATIAYMQGNVPVRGELYFQTDPQQVVIRSYSAPASRMVAQRNLLLDILANFHLGGPQAGETGQSGSSGRSSRAEGAIAPAPRPAQTQLVPRRAPDGSLSVNLPPD